MFATVEELGISPRQDIRQFQMVLMVAGSIPDEVTVFFFK
jgi:hypothetical protein